MTELNNLWIAALADEIEKHPATLRLPAYSLSEGRALTFEENRTIVRALRALDQSAPHAEKSQWGTGWIHGNNYKARAIEIEARGNDGEPWYQAEDGTPWSAFDVAYRPDVPPAGSLNITPEWLERKLAEAGPEPSTMGAGPAHAAGSAMEEVERLWSDPLVDNAVMQTEMYGLAKRLAVRLDAIPAMTAPEGLRKAFEQGRLDRQAEPWKQRAADMLAAAVDDFIRRGLLDARSLIADCRLDYGEPFTPEEVEHHLSKRRHLLAAAPKED